MNLSTHFTAPICLLIILWGTSSCSNHGEAELNGAAGHAHHDGPVDQKVSEPLKDSIHDHIHGQEASHELTPLDDPIVKTTDYHMRDADDVFGVVVSGIARAYPWWVIKNYHVVNDTIGQTPVLISFCEQCSAASAFRRSINGELLSMKTVGVYNGTILLGDRETGSLWSPFDGVSISGSRKGEELERLPIVLTRWAEWKKRHPDSGVVFGHQFLRQGHGDFYAPGKWGIDDDMIERMDSWDTRLPEHALVYGIESEGTSRAFPMVSVSTSGNLVNDEVDNLPVVVLARGEYEMSGYERTLEGRVLTFDVSAEGESTFMHDRETGTHWTFEGLAVRGPLKDKELNRLDGYLSEWHVWYAYHPHTEIYGPIVPEIQTNIVSKFHGEIVFPEMQLACLSEDGIAPIETPKAINVIFLWATWCPPCRERIPELEHFLRDYSGTNLTASSIAIHMASATGFQRIRNVAEEENLSFPVFLVTEPAYEVLEKLCLDMGRFGVILPMAFVVDGDRRVQAVVSGEGLKELPTIINALAQN